MADSGKSNTIVLQKGSVENIDEIEVMAKTTGDEAKPNHSGNLDENDSSLEILIVLRKGIRSCTKHFIYNYVSYHILSP